MNQPPSLEGTGCDRPPVTGSVGAVGRHASVPSAAVKRGFDVFVAATALLVLSPVLLALALAVRVRVGSPVLFRQARAGENGAPFELVKLRTMTDAQGPDGGLLPDADRLTPLGGWLRSNSLDELPELWNVVRGDMSLVGPRPLPVHYLDRYTERERRRHDVKPGLTGWAQVNGRNATSWDERLDMDLWYVENRSLRLDLRILARTVGVVLGRQGISAEGEATMSELPPLEVRFPDGWPTSCSPARRRRG